MVRVAGAHPFGIRVEHQEWAADRDHVELVADAGSGDKPRVALNIRLEFRDKSVPELTDGVAIVRLELVQHISEAFELTLRLRSPAAQVDLGGVIGEIARVHFFRDEDEGGAQAEPHLPLVEGLVRRARQLSARPDGMSTYELVVVHQLWLFTLRRTHGIQQELSAPAIFKGKIERRNAKAKVRIPELKEPAVPTRVREYTVQYAETEYDFIRRILAEDGIAFYFTGSGLTTTTLVHDTSASRSPVQPMLPYLPTADALRGDTDAVIAIELGVELETTGKLVRDYHFDNPRFRADGEATGHEWDVVTSWSDYSYEEGALHAFANGKSTLLESADANAVAKRRVEAITDSRWIAEVRATCPIPVGAVLTVTGDHPVAGTAMTVVRAHTVLESPDEARARGAVQVHRFWCTPASAPWRPRLLPKPRIHGIQRATVIGPEHIHVDEHGRVLLAFFWDIATDDVADPEATDLRPTRRVPVSHGWAGPSHGFVTLPRCGDEVLVAYIDGDPDEPVVVGRVYNGINRGEVKLPDDRTQSLWRTQSSPSKDGFHELRFEDKSGSEELHLEAQRLHTRLVKGSEEVNVQGDRDITVDRTETEVIHEDHSRTVDGNETVAVGGNRQVTVDGNYERTVHGSETIVVDGKRDKTVGGNQMDTIGGDWLSLVTGSIGRNAAHHGTVVRGQANVFCDSRSEDTKGTHEIKADMVHVTGISIFGVVAGDAYIIANTIGLYAGGSTIIMDAGSITISAPVVKINS